MDGFNSCIFAYGQTGSGKTFTMEGPPSNRGVNVKALHSMFKEGEARKKSLGMSYTFSVTMCEIYREEVYDLLPETLHDAGFRQKINLRQGKKGVYAEGLNSVEVETATDVENLVKRGNKNRSVGSHNFNEHSSRSHLVVTVQIKRQHQVDGSLRKFCSQNTFF
jgi:kinesin family member C2/C3